ncbi:MAG TPA: ATP-binding cassette domain-containing protein [Thermoanaerobaculia bacterium]|jgi:molybdate transport system ATP-binding protein
MSLGIRELLLPLGEITLDVTLQLDARTTALFGPSGAGKTTLLECIAGLRRPKRGRIELHGREVSNLPPRLRRIGYVPQDDALFPHLSVRQNVFYGAREEGAGVIAVLELAPLLERSVERLSGGERKRVALARALLTKPDLLLLDEPLAGVDHALRDRVLEYLVRVRDELAVPTVYVTHDMAEAAALCDEVVLLDRGRLTGRRRLHE